MTAAARRHPLNRETIFDVALSIVDSDGADRLTMRRLGERLGVDPMAVYHHVPNKLGVLDGIVERIWSGVELPAASPGEGWTDVLYETFQAFRRRLLQHPRAVPIVGSRPFRTPQLLQLIEQMLERLATAGLAGKDAMQLIDCLSGFTIGKVLAETSGMFEDDPEQITGDLSAESHPHLARTLAEGYVLAPDEEFALGLQAMLAGWQGLPQPEEGPLAKRRRVAFARGAQPL